MGCPACSFRTCTFVKDYDPKNTKCALTNLLFLRPVPFDTRHCSPGQEEGNVPFVENAGFGKYSGDPQIIAETVGSWLASPETMTTLQNAALNAARPSATLDIAKDLANMVFEAKMKKPQLVKVSSKRA